MKKTLLWLMVCVVIVAVVAIRIRAGADTAPARSTEEIQAEQGIPVDAVTLRRGELTVTRELTGEVFGLRQTNLTPGMDRKVGRVHVREGDRVARGQALMEFDTTTSPDRMTQLVQLEEAAENARRQVERLRPLHGKGAISDSDLDDAETRLAIAEASLRDARLQVDLVSPIDGLVTLVAATPGGAVRADETVAQVATLDSVRVVGGVSAEVARELVKGASVRAMIDAPGTGRLTRVALGADPDTRLHLVEAVLSNPGMHLRPGEVVTLSAAVRTVPDALRVPRAALLGASDVDSGARVEVFRVRDGRAEIVPIRLGGVTEDHVEATEGLAEGDVVVVFGANRLREGAKVRFHDLDGVRVNAPAASAGEAGAPGTGETDSGRESR